MSAKRLLPLLLLAAAAAGAYFYFYGRPVPLVLTGIVTTNDVVVSPQIGGKIERLLMAVIAPDELQAESAFAAHSAEGVVSQGREAEAALRYQEVQTTQQIQQSESMLASTEAQQAAATADLENARLAYERTQSLTRDGVASAQQLDETRTAYQAAQARVDALKRQADAQRATVAMARSNAEQTSVRRSQVQTNEHLQAAAVAQR